MSNPAAIDALLGDLQPEARAPHWHSREVLRQVNSALLVALVPIVVVATLLFGWRALLLVATAAVTALACEVLMCRVNDRPSVLRNGHTLLLATLLALSLPPSCGLLAAALGSALMVLVMEVFGGPGHYLWHPSLVARAILALAMTSALAPDDWFVLKRAHLITGSGESLEALPANISWFDAHGSEEFSAWSVTRPMQLLTRLYDPARPQEGSASDTLLKLIRDELPPASDCLWGTIGGGLGETSVAAILLGGLFLVYRGQVHWTLPAGAVAGLMLMASILPIPNAVPGQPVVWWPIRLWSGPPLLPVGLIMVFYHVLVGEFLFAVFFLASDMTASPLRQRGHLYFGFGIGALTAVLRFSGFAFGAGYWAILIMNTFIPLIDRWTRPRVYGT